MQGNNQKYKGSFIKKICVMFSAMLLTMGTCFSQITELQNNMGNDGQNTNKSENNKLNRTDSDNEPMRNIPLAGKVMPVKEYKTLPDTGRLSGDVMPNYFENEENKHTAFWKSFLNKFRKTK